MEVEVTDLGNSRKYFLDLSSRKFIGPTGRFQVSTQRTNNDCKKRGV